MQVFVSMSESYNLAINSNHALISKIFFEDEREREREREREGIEQA